MIERFSPSLLTHHELPAASRRFSAAVHRTLPAHSYMQELTALVDHDIERLAAALGRSPGSEFTSKLSRQDQIRDDAYYALRDFSKASSNRNNPEIASAGNTINEMILGRQLNLNRLGYHDKTTKLSILIESLETAEAQAALNLIGGTPWFEELVSAQQQFELTLQERVKAEAQADTPRLAPSRAKLASHVETMLDNIKVLHDIAELNGDTETLGQMEELISVINEIIAEFMAIGRARRTREESRETKEANSTTQAAPVVTPEVPLTSVTVPIG